MVVDPLEVAREYSVERVLEKGRRAFTMLTAGSDQVETAPQPESQAETDYFSLDKEQAESQAASGTTNANREQPPDKQERPPQTGEPEQQKGCEVPKNGNGRKEMDQDQKLAITKMASRYRIQTDVLDRVLAGVKYHDEAAKVINELNKGDISRFLPAPPA